jgi:hypothetical protein
MLIGNVMRFGAAMPRKSIKRRPWSDQDVRELKRLAKAKVPAAQIARKFKRTEGALRQKALHLGVSLNSRSKRRRSKK